MSKFLECPLCFDDEVEMDVVYAGNTDEIVGHCITCSNCDTELTMYNASQDRIIKVWNSMMD